MLLNGNSGGWSECVGDAGQSYQTKEKRFTVNKFLPTQLHVCNFNRNLSNSPIIILLTIQRAGTIFHFFNGLLQLLTWTRYLVRENLSTPLQRAQ